MTVNVKPRHSILFFKFEAVGQEIHTLFAYFDVFWKSQWDMVECHTELVLAIGFPR